MKSAIVQIAVAASIVAGAAAQPHQHNHMHLHKKHEVEKRAVEVVPETKTVYVIGGKEVSATEAQAGIQNGLYNVVGETTPTFTPPPPEPTTTSSSKTGGMFLEQAVTTSSSSSSSSTPTPTPTSTSATPTPTPSTPSGGGITADFPDGELSCDSPPYDYGAIAIEWLGLNGWSGVQETPDYSIGDLAISLINTAISGQTCGPNSWCTYGCPDGYLPSQWPEAQGATGQSVGGLRCNSDNKLELSRPSVKQICVPGAGGIKVVNKMSKNVAICRTAYPGTESMVNPLNAQPGASVVMANVNSDDYYNWQGKSTTLQYYVNQPGVSIEDGCVWRSPTNPDDGGNWAPTIIGAGMDSSGITYLSIFPNLPTSSAKPSFNIKVTGDVTMSCGVKNGVYETSDTGCTTGINPGGTAVIEFYD